MDKTQKNQASCSSSKAQDPFMQQLREFKSIVDGIDHAKKCKAKTLIQLIQKKDPALKNHGIKLNVEKLQAFNQMFQQLLRKDFSSFLQKVFQTLHSQQSFETSWHIDLLAEQLNLVHRGKCKRLIINVPPRCLKSICTSVAWPAWILGHNPGARIIAVSYSQALSTKHSYDCRAIMNSEWYRKIFPETRIAEGYDTKVKFVTTQHGFRFATSVNGTLTGEGADFIIVDDPHNPMQVFSDVERQKTAEWFQQTLLSRLNNRKEGSIVLVMQRLHETDLTGVLLEQASKNWQVLSIPLLNDEAQRFSAGDFSYLRPPKEPLRTLCKDFLEVEKLKSEVGDYVFCAQYQQKPFSVQNNIIQDHWLQRWNWPSSDFTRQDLAEFDAIYQSWDCAIKEHASADYSVGLTIGEKEGKLYLLHLWRQS